MRVSVIVAETESGKWVPVALPDKSVDDQRQIVRDAIASNGVLNLGGKNPQRVRRLMRFDQYARKIIFHERAARPSAPTV